MLSRLSRRLRLPANSYIIQSKNPLKSDIQKLEIAGKKIGGYCAIHSRKFFLKKFSNIQFYHTSTITEQSFQVTPTTIVESELDNLQFEKISDETLDALAEYFDEIVERADHLPDADVNYGDGVLTIKFGDNEGTYVINRQTPNKQIWLSSPKSGPKRYDFTNGTWIYKHDGKSLHQLLDDEISLVVHETTGFTEKCLHSRQITK